MLVESEKKWEYSLGMIKVDGLVQRCVNNNE